jgi:subtilase family serine protease
VRITPLKLKLAAVLTASATAAALSVGAAAPAGAAGTTIQPHRVKVNPDIHRVSINPDAVHFGCQDRPIDGSLGPRCYQPAQMQAAYDVAPLLAQGKDGSGRSIVIVDAYQSPYVAQDLQIQDSTFGLPDANLQVFAPQGVPTFDPNDGNQVGWAEETTLDVLWAHAIAPGATIKLVQARSNQDADIYNATKWAVDHKLGDVLSQSFGEAESCMDPKLLSKQHTLFTKASREGMTLFASSGDSGAAQFNCDGSAAIEAASSPASDPLVTGVGGTTLNADSTTGAYLGETAWTEIFGCNPPAVDPSDVNCSGGGFSTIYRKPAFQNRDVPGQGRGVPDVAYNAGVNGGVLTHCGICNLANGLDPADPTIFFLFGGTSAGSPQWAAIAAIGDQIAHRRLGDINPALYDISHQPGDGGALHDITTGNNDVAEIGGGFDAGAGWDAVTGVGSPDAAHLLPQLIHRTDSGHGGHGHH